MPEKTSGKTPKTRNSSTVKSVKYNKNTASKKKALSGKIPKVSTATDKPKTKKNESKEAVHVIAKNKNTSNNTSVSELKADTTLPEKIPKTRNLSTVKSVKTNKNTASKKKALTGKIPKISTATGKPKTKTNESKETVQVIVEDKNKSKDRSFSELKADKLKAKKNEQKETVQVIVKDKNTSNDTFISDLKADKPKAKNYVPKETVQGLVEDKNKSKVTSGSKLKAGKPRAKKNEPKEAMQELSKGKNKSDDAFVNELTVDKPTSKIAEKISSDLDRKNASYIEPYGEDILFLSDRHKSMVNEVVSCLKSNSPFCFLGSEAASYHEYYKEIIIDHIKIKEKIELLYFDPKFGDDLSVIINKELKNVDISLIGSLNTSISRKILIIDNENFANDMDWELIDSLRLELKVINIGVFAITPAVLGGKVKSVSSVSNFKAFYLPAIIKSELKKIDEYVSKHSYKNKHLETLSSLLMKGSGNDLSGRNPPAGEVAGFWHKLREYIRRR